MRMSWNNKATQADGEKDRMAREALLGALSISEDVLAQISGGATTKDGCHSVSPRASLAR